MTRVLVLGGSRFYLRAIERLARHGFETVVADRNESAPALRAAWRPAVCDIVDIDGIARVAESNKVDGILPLNDLGVRTAAQVSARLKLPGLDSACVARVTEKHAMRDAWRDAGIACPRYVHCRDVRELRAAIDAVGLPCILKPALGITGGCRGVVAIEDRNQIDAMIVAHLEHARNEGHLVEELVTCQSEHSAEVLIGPRGPLVIAIGDKEKTPLPYRVDRAVLYPTLLAGHAHARAIEAIEAAISALGISIGAAHIEFAMRDDAPVFFEVGARAGGGGTPDPIMPYVTGLDYVVELARTCCGLPFMSDLTPSHNRGCTYRFLAATPGSVTSVSGLDKVRKTPGILDADVLVSAGDQIRQIKIGPDRPGFVIAGGPDRAAADTLSRWAESSIRIETAGAD